MTTSKFFETNQQFSKAVEPGKTPLYNPSSCLELWIPALHFDFFSSLPNMRDIKALNTLIKGRNSAIPFISTQMLSPTNFSFWTFCNYAVQCIRQQFHVVLLCSSHDEGQRDATTVDENASFAPIFFPDQSDCGRHLQAQAALCSFPRRYFATARQYPPFHRIQQDRPSIIFRKNRPSAIQENIGGSRSDCQSVPSAQPSIVCRFVTHIQFRQKQFEVGLAFVLLQDLEGICVVVPVFYGVSTPLPSPKIHPKSPMNTVAK
jgi:hypothetical protein